MQSGYRRALLVDDGGARIYPGLVSCESSRCNGLLFSDITDEELAWPDVYEGDEYLCILVVVFVDGQPIFARVCLCVNQGSLLIPGHDWHLSNIDEESLARFIRDKLE